MQVFLDFCLIDLFAKLSDLCIVFFLFPCILILSVLVVISDLLDFLRQLLLLGSKNREHIALFYLFVDTIVGVVELLVIHQFLFEVVECLDQCHLMTLHFSLITFYIWFLL